MVFGAPAPKVNTFCTMHLEVPSAHYDPACGRCTHFNISVDLLLYGCMVLLISSDSLNSFVEPFCLNWHFWIAITHQNNTLKLIEVDQSLVKLIKFHCGLL